MLPWRRYSMSWVAIVLVGYAAIFVALVIGLMFAQQGGDNRSRRSGGLPGGMLGYAFLRVLGDALFWTFHPFSPFSVYSSPWGDGYGARGGSWGRQQNGREARGAGEPKEFDSDEFAKGRIKITTDELLSERDEVAALELI